MLHMVADILMLTYGEQVSQHTDMLPARYTMTHSRVRFYTRVKPRPRWRFTDPCSMDLCLRKLTLEHLFRCVKPLATGSQLNTQPKKKVDMNIKCWYGSKRVVSWWHQRSHSYTPMQTNLGSALKRLLQQQVIRRSKSRPFGYAFSGNLMINTYPICRFNYLHGTLLYFLLSVEAHRRTGPLLAIHAAGISDRKRVSAEMR